MFLLEQGEIGALRHAEGALERDPSNPRYMRTLALSLEAAGKPDEAVEAMTKAVALDEAYADDLERMKASAQ